MKIGCLGCGTWGFTMTSLLASKGYEVVAWARDAAIADELQKTRAHPRLKDSKAANNIRFTSNLADAVIGADVLVEAITSKGIRPVMDHVRNILTPTCPIVITSKGIEQNSGLILPDVVIEVFGEQVTQLVGALSGPGYAQEIIRGLPTSIVGTAYSSDVMKFICDTFTTKAFRVYPNADVRGVEMAGALKNIIAIACGISDGLKFGNGAKAALMTRGLHEIHKLGVSLGCRSETFMGLAGMGDIFLTCSSSLSRNYQFGMLLAQGKTPDEARAQIGMVVEGAYTCVSALQLSKLDEIPMPITEHVHKIIYEDMQPAEAVLALMSRTIKEEHL